MAEQPKSAADTQRSEDWVKKQRQLDAEGGVREVPEPKHGDPTEAAPPAPGDSVLGVRVGSEASVDNGTGPVLPPPSQAGGEFTRVRNRDLQERDKREWKKRGMRSDGTTPAGRAISVSFEGVMMVEPQGNEQDATLHSGGYTGQIPEDGVLVRPLTSEEEEKYFGSPQGARSQRSNDLVAGGGQGGGGNPMHAGDVRGVSSNTATRVGEGGVTSASGPAPAPRPGGQGAPKPKS